MLRQAQLRCMLCRKRCRSAIFTYVYEVRPVLAGHAETEIPPEARVFLDHLQGGRRAQTHKQETHTPAPTVDLYFQQPEEGNIPKTSQQCGRALRILCLVKCLKGGKWRRLARLPAAAPQVGCARDFHKSEWGCTG